MPQATARPLDESGKENAQPEPQPYPDQQMEQQEYNDYDDEEEITGALVATRQNKKKAADDAKLLANRIALLKLEEKKAWKKIEETKKKAE